MVALQRDVRFAVRSLRGTFRLSLAALACVAVGTAAAVFVITIANSILFRPPPFPNADRLVRLWTVARGNPEMHDVSYLDARDVRAQARSLDALEVASRTRLAVSTGNGTERVRGESISPGYLDLIAMKPALGRAFTHDEYTAGAPPVIIISHALWFRSFGGQHDVIGKTVRARGNSGQGQDELFTIVGVMPPNFVGTVDSDVSDFWIPIEQYRPRQGLERRTSRSTWVLARLKAGVTLATAQAEVARIGDVLAGEYPADYVDTSLAIEPLGESWRSRFRDGLAMLTAAAMLLLLIGCANVSHLMLARLARQEHELCLRGALGATRGMIIRQLMIESSVLAIVGGVAGVLMAVWGVRLFAAAGVFQLPPYVTLAIDWRSVVMAIGLLMLTALLSGVLPAWLGARLETNQLRQGGRSTTLGKQQKQSINALVVAEVAFSFLVLIGSTLMLRTYSNLIRADVGYRTQNVLRLAVSLDAQTFPDAPAQLRFAREAKAVLASESGVRGVSFMAGILPPWDDPVVSLAVHAVVRPELASVNRHSVDEDFFRVLEIPVVAGRAFSMDDRPDSRRVAVVSRLLARALSGGDEQSAVGQTFDIVPTRPGTDQVPLQLEVIGVVDDVQYRGPRKARAADYDLYLPITQAPGGTLSIAVATVGDAALLQTSLQRTLASLAQSSPVHWVSTMEAELAMQYGDARLYAWLTAVFGSTAVLLVVIGIYGVISNAVARRLGELGVRIAVGATPNRIMALVMWQAARPLLTGLAIGGVVAVVATPLVSRLVYGTAATDPILLTTVASGMLTVGLIASYLPARRATRIDPLVVLRRG